MSLPKNSAASGMLYGIVVGGDQSDPDPDQAGGVRVYFPTVHGQDVDPKHLGFSPRLLSPDRQSMQSFPGGLDPGSMVVALKDTGSTQCQVLGLASDLNNAGSGIAGNMGLFQMAPILQQFMNKSTGVSRPPNIQQGNEGGATVFNIQERGDHSHNLLQGLPTHGALFPLSGIPIDPIKSIHTAIQAAANIPGADILSKLPGVAMSLGGLMNKLLSNAKQSNTLRNSMPPQAFAALTSMGNLIQSMEQSESTGFMTAGRVNPDVYSNNAITLLSQTTNLSDVVAATTHLQSNTSLFGMESYGTITIEQETAFGNVKMNVSATGETTVITPDAVLKQMNDFAKLMSNASSFPSAVPGQNLFGDSAGTIMNMIQRLPSGDATQAINLLKNLNTSSVAQDLNKMFQSIINGGNPRNHVR